MFKYMGMTREDEAIFMDLDYSHDLSFILKIINKANNSFALTYCKCAEEWTAENAPEDMESFIERVNKYVDLSTPGFRVELKKYEQTLQTEYEYRPINRP